MIATRWLVAAGFTLSAGCGAPAPPPYRPVADLKQLMASVVEPAAEVYWDAVGTIVDEKGAVEFAPQTLEEWDAVRNSAFVIAESGNLMMMAPRARDGGDWMKLSRALVAAGQRAIEAAEARNERAVFDVGAELYDACTACHSKYAVDLLRPNAQDD
jgi:hypothetical protein